MALLSFTHRYPDDRFYSVFIVIAAGTVLRCERAAIHFPGIKTRQIYHVVVGGSFCAPLDRNVSLTSESNFTKNIFLC